MGMFDGPAGTINLGVLPTLWTLTAPLYILGGLLFGIATFRAGILPRVGGRAARHRDRVGAPSPHCSPRVAAENRDTGGARARLVGLCAVVGTASASVVTPPAQNGASQ